MAVNLSPVGGVAAQFFNNDGTVLSGGKIYTYTAGTTTPATTYTTSAGSIAHSNPIILTSAGRVPTGEIWLTDGISYKFVLNDANDVLIATYDNITGINSNFVNFTNSQEIQTATANQTVFTLTTMQYQPGTGSLSVFVDGVNQYGPGAQYAFTETSSTVVTFVNGLHVGASVKFTTSAINASSYGNASQITYTPAGTGAVNTNVQAKLRESVSVKDFGAVGDGTTNDTAAIQAAINYGASANVSIFFPAATYLIQGTLTAGTLTVLYGEGIDKTILKKKSASTGHILDILGTTQKYDIEISNMTFDVNGIDSGIVAEYVTNFTVRNCKFKTMALWGVHVGVQNGADASIRNTRVILQNCIFETSSSTYEQFLVFNSQDVVVSGCSFKTGASAIGIGIYQNVERVTIENSYFSINIGLYYSVSTNNINITDCDFNQCTSAIKGANQSDNGAFGASVAYNICVEGCRFRANTTGLQLGAVYNATIATSIFDNNKQQAIFIDDGNAPVANQSQSINIVDCVFQNNNFDNGASINNPAILFSAVGGAMYATISNCSFWDNQATRTQLYPISFVGAFTWTNIIVSECRLSAYLGGLSIGLSGGTLGANVRMLDCLDVSATVAAGVLSNNIAYTVATLPTAANAGAAARAYVTDASATTFASVVASGGANKVPVYSNGTNWLIG